MCSFSELLCFKGVAMKSFKLSLTMGLVIVLAFVLTFALIGLVGCGDTEDTSTTSIDELEYVDAEAQVNAGNEYGTHKAGVDQVENLVLKDGEEVALSWDAVEDADEYEVFRSTHPHLDFGRIARIESTHFVDPDPISDQPSHYKVRALKHLHGTEKHGHLSAGVKLVR